MKHFRLLQILTVLCVVFLVACGSDEIPSKDSALPSITAEQITLTFTPTVQPIINTATSIPDTLIPTSTVTPTPTPQKDLPTPTTCQDESSNQSHPFSASDQARVKRMLEWILNGLNDPFATQHGESYYQMIVLSSGDLYVIELDEYRLDVLDIYLMMKPGPIRVPLIVGFEDAGGTYTSLVAIKQDVNRDELLEHVAATYPRWKESTIMLMGNFVMGTRSVDWEKCTDNQTVLQLTLNSYCAIGELLESTYSVEMQLLRTQALALDRVPEGFVLPWLLLPPH